MLTVIGLHKAEETVFYWQIPKPTSHFHYLVKRLKNLPFKKDCGFNTVPRTGTAMVTIETTDIETALSQSLLEVTVIGSGLA